ncbi:MAG: phosphoribosylanthranilate isomerase [Bacteroidales bacterium]
MLIKVCGITNNSNLTGIAHLRPDFMGFIFHKGSPRDVTGTIENLQISAIPASVKKVAVVVNQPSERVRELVKKYGFDAVQLHGDEDPDYCKELMPLCQVIKAFRIKDKLPENLERYENNCHIFLFDAKGKYRGGNGIKFNHDILKSYKLKTPYILSGGIGDNDLPYLQNIKLEGIAGVDLNSRFEISPGYKSISSLKEFINKLRYHAGNNKQ